MLKKADKLKLKAYGFDVDKLIAAVTAEDEQDFSVPEIATYTDDQLAERDTNTVKTARAAIFKEGKDAGIEIANKAIVKKYNLVDVDTKDPDKVIAALDKTVATGDEGLKTQIGLLQKDKDNLQASLDAEKTNFAQAQRDTDLISHFPPNRKGLTDKEFLMLTKSALKIEDKDGVTEVSKDGVVLRDPKTQAPIPVKEAVASLFTEKKWVGDGDGGSGRGGDDNSGSGGAGITKFSQAETQFLKDNPSGNVISPEFQTYVQGLAKETSNFDFDN